MFDEILFTTNDFSHYIFFEKIIFLDGDTIQSIETTQMVPNIRSSISPDASGTSCVINRLAEKSDP